MTINNPDSAFYKPDDDSIDLKNKYINSELHIMFEELDFDISSQEVLKSVKQLQKNLNGGPDFLLNYFFYKWI